ncbi:MAG: WcaF family extracellular polysaccharide biosynthesis acetyltransferase [Crocinitomicaceae bacterium]
MKTRLDTFDNSWYKPGSKVRIAIWFIFNAIILKSKLNPFSRIKIVVLRLFGAKIGKGVVIKPSISVKYPWKLTVGDYVWIGENVWIDNLDEVIIGNHVCISQGALLLCGNHNYKKSSFDLIVKPIELKDGAWIGARATVTQGVVCNEHSVLSVQSVANSDLMASCIYQGVPAIKIRERLINDEA